MTGCCPLCNEKYGSIVSNDMSYVTGSSDADPIIKQHAYHWIFSKESYATKRRMYIEGWEYLPEYSNSDVCVYQRNNYCIVAFRGTQTVSDIYNDVQLSKYGNQCDFQKVQPSITFIQDLLVTDPGLIIQVTGHSLGGAIARCVASALNLVSVTFNSAAPPSSPKQNRVSDTAYHIEFDIISAWQSNCVRIDKGYRPKKLGFIYRLIGTHFMKQSIRPMLDAHNIDNFSNSKPGQYSSTVQENDLWQSWYQGLSLKFKLVFLAFLGTTHLPTLPL